MVTSRRRKTGNYVAWARQSDGFLKSCRDCGRTIYLKLDTDGKWRPYSSWIEGDAAEGEWRRHHCRAATADAQALSYLSKKELNHLDAAIRKTVSAVVEESFKKRR